jgi:hypothetical protein
MVLRLISCSPRRPALLPPSPAKLASRELDTSVGVSGPHAFAVRLSAVRQERIRVHRIPPYVRDDRETPLCVGRDGGSLMGDLGKSRSGIFLRRGLDDPNQPEIVQQFFVRAQGLCG